MRFGRVGQVEILASTSLEKRLLAINKTLDYVAAQKQRRSVCLQSCEGGVQPCQASDCCQGQQRATSSTVVGGGAGVGVGGQTVNGSVGATAVRTSDIIIVDDDDDQINAMSAALS